MALPNNVITLSCTNLHCKWQCNNWFEGVNQTLYCLKCGTPMMIPINVVTLSCPKPQCKWQYNNWPDAENQKLYCMKCGTPLLHMNT